LDPKSNPKSKPHNPTAIDGVCEEFLALEEEDAIGPDSIVSAMVNVWAGAQDHLIYARYYPNGGRLPKLKGNQDDSATDLPLCLQTQLQTLGRELEASAATVKNYVVSILFVCLFVCLFVRWFVCVFFFFVCPISFFFLFFFHRPHARRLKMPLSKAWQP
jgi:hypothetical protein